jgi:hypothetical protein
MKKYGAKDELDYLQLIEEVALIDKAAAEYMQGPMREITGFAASDDLWDVIVWELTPQGHDYWYNIASQL